MANNDKKSPIFRLKGKGKKGAARVFTIYVSLFDLLKALIPYFLLDLLKAQDSFEKKRKTCLILLFFILKNIDNTKIIIN